MSSQDDRAHTPASPASEPLSPTVLSELPDERTQKRDEPAPRVSPGDPPKAHGDKEDLSRLLERLDETNRLLRCLVGEKQGQETSATATARTSGADARPRSPPPPGMVTATVAADGQDGSLPAYRATDRFPETWATFPSGTARDETPDSRHMGTDQYRLTCVLPLLQVLRGIPDSLPACSGPGYAQYFADPTLFKAGRLKLCWRGRKVVLPGPRLAPSIEDADDKDSDDPTVLGTAAGLDYLSGRLLETWPDRAAHRGDGPIAALRTLGFDYGVLCGYHCDVRDRLRTAKCCDQIGVSRFYVEPISVWEKCGTDSVYICDLQGPRENTVSVNSMAFVTDLMLMASNNLEAGPARDAIRKVQRTFHVFTNTIWQSDNRRKLHNLWDVDPQGGFHFSSFNFRCAAPRSRPRAPGSSSRPRGAEPVQGLCCDREHGRLPSPPGRKRQGRSREGVDVSERRLSVLMAYCNQDTEDALGHTTTSIAVLSDVPDFHGQFHYLVDPVEGIARGPLSGMRAFVAVLARQLKWWELTWVAALDNIDDNLRIDVKDILDDSIRKRLMFDDSFQRSELYFSLLQLLRMYHDWISETAADLHMLRQFHSIRPADARQQYPFGRRRRWVVRHGWCTGEEYDAELAACESAWDAMLERFEETKERLLGRIQAKREEIMMLRDGLFNATALLESSKSTTMNRYVIVFTVMTVLYLPPSFIATVFGMDMPSMEATMYDFKTSTISVSLVTYVAAVVLILIADRKNIVNGLRTHFTALLDQVRPLMHGRGRARDRADSSSRVNTEYWTEAEIVAVANEEVKAAKAKADMAGKRGAARDEEEGLGGGVGGEMPMHTTNRSEGEGIITGAASRAPRR